MRGAVLRDGGDQIAIRPGDALNHLFAKRAAAVGIAIRTFSNQPIAHHLACRGVRCPLGVLPVNLRPAPTGTGKRPPLGICLRSRATGPKVGKFHRRVAGVRRWPVPSLVEAEIIPERGSSGG